jgi:hypothetical protein
VLRSSALLYLQSYYVRQEPTFVFSSKKVGKRKWEKKVRKIVFYKEHLGIKKVVWGGGETVGSSAGLGID